MNHIDIKFPLKPQKIFRMLLGVHRKFYTIPLEEMLDNGEHESNLSQSRHKLNRIEMDIDLSAHRSMADLDSATLFAIMWDVTIDCKGETNYYPHLIIESIFRYLTGWYGDKEIAPVAALATVQKSLGDELFRSCTSRDGGVYPYLLGYVPNVMVGAQDDDEELSETNDETNDEVPIKEETIDEVPIKEE